MIPAHVKEELSKLSSEQQIRFQELVAWASNSGLSGTSLPVDYSSLLEMVKRMDSSPVNPVAPIIPDDPEFTFKDYFKNPEKK